MQARNHLAKIQRVMYQRLQLYARRHSPEPGVEFQRYLKVCRSELKNFQRVATKPELIHTAAASNIIIVGDYHTLAQAQKTLVRILREVLPKTKKQPVVIAIEWLRPEDNFTVARFIRDQISESKFLEEVRFYARWGFEWENYRPVFQFAKEFGLSIIGLSGGEQRLKERDRFAAKRIAAVFGVHPSAIVFVLIGDLHLGSFHLPLEIKKCFALRSPRKVAKLKPKIMTIHQNIENFYWALVDRGLEHEVNVVRIGPQNYCVLNTPPWLKLQSHLKWLEFSESSPEEDPFEEMDLLPEAADIINHVKEFLGYRNLKLLQEPSIGGPNELGFLAEFKISDRKLVRRYLRTFESFCIPQFNKIVLTTLSLNQLAAQVTRLLHAQLSGSKQIFYKPKDFYRLVIEEALAFLGSKIINPRRKCNGLSDLDRIAHSKPVRLRHREFIVSPDVAKFSATLLRQEPRLKPLPRVLGSDKLIFYHKVAKILGHLLGEGLYQGTLARHISKMELRQLFQDPLFRSKRVYGEWITRLDQYHLRHQSKHDTL